MSIASRAVVCAVVCAALGGCPKDDVARPLERGAPPTHGLADARVLHVLGNVEITSPVGAAFAAKVGTDLVADDRIGAATSSMVVVALRNGHVVRIDDAGALKVRDIVLFQAPPTDRAVEEQLRELLDEGETVPLADVRERAAAWRQMLRAAETGGAESSAVRDEAKSAAPAAPARAMAESAAAQSAAAQSAAAQSAAAENAERAMAERAMAERATAAERVAPSEAAKAAAAEAARDAVPTEPDAKDAPKSDELGLADDKTGVALGLRGAGPGGGGAGGAGSGIGSIGRARGGVDKDTQGVAIDSLAQPQAQAAPPPGFTARFGASAQAVTAIEVTPALAAMASELGACIARSLPANVTPSSIELLVEVRDGKAKRVRLGGALPVPLCARSVAVESAAREIAAARGGAGGWLVVTVPLSQ